MTCEHENFTAAVDVNRITGADGETVERYCADVRIKCVDCGVPFRFMGLPAGVDMNGAAVSACAEEAHLAIAPRGAVVCAMEGGTPTGFSIRRTQ